MIEKTAAVAQGERIVHDGRVVLPNGKGAPAALVFVKTGSVPSPEIAIRSDGAGRFRIALPPGRFTLEARTTEGKLGEAKIETGGEVASFQIDIRE